LGGSAYRDKKVVGVFVSFRAPLLHQPEPSVCDLLSAEKRPGREPRLAGGGDWRGVILAQNDRAGLTQSAGERGLSVLFFRDAA
jgi:hypothetical protein